MKLSEKAQKALQAVITKFENGDLSPVVNAVRLEIDSNAPARNWTIRNRILAYAQSNCLDCRGYRQWQQVGRQVQRGSKAAHIFRPSTKTITETKDGKKEKRQICTGFATISVFPISMTEGDELPSYAPTKLPPLIDVAKKLGVNITYQPLPPDRLGDCAADGTKIRLGTQDNEVFYHELAHAAHSIIDGGLKGGQTAA